MQGGRLMLKRVGNRELLGKTEIFIKEASFPVPFQPGLEFNSPVHGNWNIVHTGMLVPEARQIYVCADIHSPIRYSEDFLCCIPCSD